MTQDADRRGTRSSASRDGLAAIAIILVTLALIVLVVSALL